MLPHTPFLFILASIIFSLRFFAYSVGSNLPPSEDAGDVERPRASRDGALLVVVLRVFMFLVPVILLLSAEYDLWFDRVAVCFIIFAAAGGVCERCLYGILLLFVDEDERYAVFALLVEILAFLIVVNSFSNSITRRRSTSTVELFVLLTPLV